MFRVILILLAGLLVSLPARASVELAIRDRKPAVIDEVYLSGGDLYLPVDDVMSVLGLEGDWDSVAHVYRFRTPFGKAVISPGSKFVRLGEQFIPLEPPPRFIDGRLRVTENFVVNVLPDLLGQDVFFRNLDPRPRERIPKSSPDDPYFAFLLKKKGDSSENRVRGIVIDPGHGGEDPGSIGPDGIKEKDVVLDLARRLQKMIKMQWDIPVFLTRDGDYTLSPQQRFAQANRPEADLLVLLHAESAFGSQPGGVVLAIRPEAPGGGGPGGSPSTRAESRELAADLAAELKKSGLAVHDPIEAPLLPLGLGDLPTVLIEAGFLSNPADLERLSDDREMDRLAGSLLRGLKSYIDKTGG